MDDESSVDASTRTAGQSCPRGKTRFDGPEKAGPGVCTLKFSLIHLGRQRADWLDVPDAREGVGKKFESAVATWMTSGAGRAPRYRASASSPVTPERERPEPTRAQARNNLAHALSPISSATTKPTLRIRKGNENSNTNIMASCRSERETL